MDYSVEEKVFAAAWAIAFNCEESARLFTDKFDKKAPSPRTILYWKKKLVETGSLACDRPRSGRPVTASGDEQKVKVIALVAENPTTSTRAIASDVQISQSSVCKILKNDLYYPYKPLYNQFLCDGDSDRRLQFCQEIQAKFDADPSFLQKLAFSDECVFSLCGNVNKHNAHYWATQNPMFRIGNPGKTPTLTVWACISYNGLLLFDIRGTTMNSQWYCELLNEKVIPYFTRGIGRKMFFQQDGAPPHYSLEARRILNTDLSDRWIGRRGHVEWPARSPDLTPIDFWFWSHLRQRVYPLGFKYTNTTELEQAIFREMQNIPLETYRISLKNFRGRITKCLSVDGSLFEY